MLYLINYIINIFVKRILNDIKYDLFVIYCKLWFEIKLLIFFYFNMLLVIDIFCYI